MATIAYPGALDANPKPDATTYADEVGKELDVLVARALLMGEALELKLGIGAASQTPSVGRVPIGLADGSTQWLLLPTTNYAINGGQERWSLGTSIAVAASISSTAGYGPDQWCLKTNATQASVIDQVAALGNSGQWAARVRRNSGQTGTGVMVYEQPLKTSEIAKLRGEYVSVRGIAKGGANWSPASGNVTLRVACGTGAQGRRGGGFTGETALINQTFAAAAGGTAATPAYTSTVVVPATATQMSICWEWTPVGTAGAADDVTVDDVILVPGTVPVPFVPRTNDEWECLTFYEVVGVAAGGGLIIRGYTTSGGAAIAQNFKFLAPKIATPTVTKNGTWGVTNTTGQPTVGTADLYGFYASISPTVTGDCLALNNAAGTNFTADARL